MTSDRYAENLASRCHILLMSMSPITSAYSLNIAHVGDDYTAKDEATGDVYKIK